MDNFNIKFLPNSGTQFHNECMQAAQVYKDYYDCLISVGFNEDQAMAILLSGLGGV